MRIQKLTSTGFTLLELLVAISIMVILFGIGFASFRGFQDRQRLVNAREALKSDLRYTQEQALANIKPTGCTTLDGYKFTYRSPTSYEISAYCPDDAPRDIIVKTVDISTKYPLVQISNFSFMTFNILGRGVFLPRSITLTDTRNATTSTIQVTSGGQINQTN